MEYFPGTASIFSLKLLVTLPVAPFITGTIVLFRFHIRCISIPKLLYFNFFSASFCKTFLSAGIATSISVIIIIIIIACCYLLPLKITHYGRKTQMILFLSFRRVLNVNYSFLGNSPASEF